MDAEQPEHDLPGEVARAFEMYAQGRTYRYIAQALGVSVSTAHARVERARAALEFTAGLDRGAERQRDLATVDTWLARLDDAYAQGGEPGKLVPAVARLLDRRARLLGLDSPTRVAVSDDRPAPAPDPAVMAAIRALQPPADDEDDEGAA